VTYKRKEYIGPETIKLKRRNENKRYTQGIQRGT
jgi:hypothetical protein